MTCGRSTPGNGEGIKGVPQPSQPQALGQNVRRRIGVWLLRLALRIDPEMYEREPESSDFQTDFEQGRIW